MVTRNTPQIVKKGIKSLLTSPGVYSFYISWPVGEARGAWPNLTFRLNWSPKGKEKSFFNKDFFQFSWQNGKFWLENKMVCLRSFRKCGLWFKEMQYLLYLFNLPLLIDLYTAGCSPTTLNFIPLWPLIMFILNNSTRVVCVNGKPPQALFFLSVWISAPPRAPTFLNSESITVFLHSKWRT